MQDLPMQKEIESAVLKAEDLSEFMYNFVMKHRDLKIEVYLEYHDKLQNFIDEGIKTLKKNRKYQEYTNRLKKANDRLKEADTAIAR